MSGTAETPRRTSAEVVRRNARVFRERERGDRWTAIAARHGISERHAYRAYEEHVRAGVDISRLDPEAVLRRVIQAHESALETAETLMTEGDNSAARIGAARTAVSASSSLLDVLVRSGLVPDAADTWTLRRDVNEFAAAMVQVAGEHGIDVEAVLARMEQRAAQFHRPGVPLIAI